MKTSRVIKMQILCKRLVREEEKIVFKGANVQLLRDVLRKLLCTYMRVMSDIRLYIWKCK